MCVSFNIVNWVNDQMDVQNHRGIKDFTPMGKVSIVILVYDNDVELVVSAVNYQTANNTFILIVPCRA